MTAPCPHYPHCVGCPLIGTAYGEQVTRKREMVRTALAAHASLATLEVPPLVGSPRAFGYRNQAKLVARRAHHGVLLGVYRPGTHHVVDISECPVHEPAIARALSDIRRVLEEREVPIYDERAANGWLRYVIVRTSQWKKTTQVILVVRARAPALERTLSGALRGRRGIGSVVLNVNADPGNVIFGRSFVPLTREAALMERVGGLKLRSSAGAFLQANLGVARRIYDRVLQWAAPEASEVAIDLYSGVGAISFYLASQAGRVFGIEESPLAVLDAKVNIRLNGFHNVRFTPGAVAEVLPALRAQLDRIDLVTLNPPRKGVDEKARAAIVACRPKRIVYVSCDPRTLSRDLAWFGEHGYRTDRVQPFDLLPQTDHVETVALLQGD